MELWLANTFLLLLLLTWLPVGLTILHCQTPSPTPCSMKWWSLRHFLLGCLCHRWRRCLLLILAFSILPEAQKGTASQQVEPVITVLFKTCVENHTVQVKCYKPECLEGENQTKTVVLRENCMNFTNTSLCTGICMCTAFITRPNSTGTGNSTQAHDLSCGCAGPQTDVTGKIWTGLNLLLCILLGLAAGTLLYMPVIGFLLWQRRRNRTGELMSGDVAEGNQAAPVTGTEDLTYANLKFENKGTRSASSNVIYTEIKPPQQKQNGGYGSAASAEVDVSLSAEGK